MEEEISLREMIEVVFQGKWIIISITCSALILSILFTFVSKPVPAYRAEATIRIEQLSTENFSPSSSGYFSALITAMMNAERYNADAFAELVKHPELILEVRNLLELDALGVPQGYLMKNLQTSVDAAKTTLTIQFTDADPDFAVRVVNTFLNSFSKFLASRQRERIELVASNLERLIALELRGLKSSRDRLLAARADYQPLLTHLETSHLSPEYGVLSSDIARITSQISQLEAQRDEIREFRLQVTTMLRKVDDWVIFTAAGSATDVTATPRRIIIAVAGTLGLMSSIFVVFFLNYWKETAPAKVGK